MKTPMPTSEQAGEREKEDLSNWVQQEPDQQGVLRDADLALSRFTPGMFRSAQVCVRRPPWFYCLTSGRVVHAVAINYVGGPRIQR